MDIVEFLKSPVLKNICEQLLLSDIISTRSIKSNLTFAQTVHLKFLFQNSNIKIISKIVNRESQKEKKKKIQFPYCICLCFYQDFKSENLCFLSLYSVHAARIPGPATRDHVKLKAFPSCSNKYNISVFLEAKFIKVLKMCWLTVNFEICSVTFTLVIEF